MSAPWDLEAPEQRDAFERYGEGVLAVVPPSPGGMRGGRPAPPSGGAWLHIGADGVVHAFTGKAEVGQGTRTALALLVAEEMRAPLTAVRMVMADTDIVPWDMGTFGSMSMPMAAPALRQAAAGARALLVELAAAHLGAGELAAGDGRIRLGDRSISYGDLVRGQRRVTMIGTAELTPPDAWTTAGRAATDPTALAAVTGALTFATDLRRPGMLHGKLLHPPAYGARLRSVDVTAARALPGVTVIQDGDEVAVAAPSPGSAIAALRAISAAWDETPQPGEHEIVDYLRAHPSEGEGFWGATHHEAGDVDAALAAAPHRLSATYTTAYIAHVPMECRAALAEWHAGRLTVWVGTQTPFMVRRELAEALAIPEAGVHVIVPATGGGFGGKHAGETALAAARLARASGRPVRIAFTREEEFAWAYFRPYAVIDVRSGAAADGTLTAWEHRNVNAGSNAVLTPYTVPNQRIDHQPAESPLPQGSYRALAATANCFARESHMDELAALVGADPLAYRLRHLADERLAAVLRAAAERAGWDGCRREAGRGLGLACAVEKGGRVATVAEVNETAGKLEVVRVVTAFECGAIVNPDNLRSQIEGCLVMGLGGALFEAIHFAGGRLSNGRLSQYRVPRFSDVPPLEIVLVSRPDQPPAGAGETPLIAIAPALANAIFAATGKRLRALPLLPAGASE